ncbi:sporulation initiation phosphotransferase B (plasmid) [Bacillus sp. 31A1R]|uniref:Sporulation initiation phosphotransferase B n=1 Tax=Robertmurraya mangrovi TaxID=3098077 RepID=A0ABU5IUJ2_9BACI|nr:sporulation initiation phosphotransferase B [Bacillus sp. 31A1R]MDZ5470827.1 sporulation initiation phosphotransferase B [Bacillus sp. 31A1R]
MKKNWTTVEVLGHARHDWLNKIQLIKGNLALNKIDRAKEIINEIVVEAQEQSKLSNMKIPQFASLLLTYNWESHSFQVEFEVLDDSANRNRLISDDIITNWTSSFFEILNSCVKTFHENYLSVTIEQQSNGTRFFFDFRGIITEKEQLMEFLSRESSMEVNVHEVSEQELALEVFLPFSE